MSKFDTESVTLSETSPIQTDSGNGDFSPSAAVLPLPPLSLGVALAALLSACGGGDTANDTGSQNGAARIGAETARAPYRPILGGSALQATTNPSQQQSATRLPTPDELMTWAEKTFPAYFPSSEVTRNSGDIIFRYYPANGNYLGVIGQGVYVLGQFTQNEVLKVGTLADFAEQVNADLSAVKVNSDAEAARFLLQAQFSASEPEIAEVRQKGFANWLDEQHARPVAQLAWD